MVKDALNNLKCIRQTPAELNPTQLPNQTPAELNPTQLPNQLKSTNVPPPLLGGPNKKYPHLSKAIEVKNDSKYLALHLYIYFACLLVLMCLYPINVKTA